MKKFLRNFPDPARLGLGASHMAAGMEANAVRGGIRPARGDKAFQAVVYVLLALLCAIVLYPIILIVSGSFSDPFELLSGHVVLFPVKPTLRMYNLTFQHPEIFGAYANTLKYTLLGVLVNVTLTMLAAYPLSRRDLFGRGLLTLFVVFTMYFSGGMIPLYLQVRDLKLLDKTWAVILPGAISVWNLIIVRTFFQNTIPHELYEAAAIDGANDVRFFITIVLPLSSAILAVITLYYGVGHWNSWFPALLYFSERKRYPLQMILREIIMQGQTDSVSGSSGTDREMIGEGIKYATMVIATIPIMCLYPFLQKFFVKGIMVGALKG